MKSPLLFFPIAASLVLTAGVRDAAADPPSPKAAPGLTLPAGVVELIVTVEANFTEGKAFEPWSVAPDVSYGVTDDLQLSLVHGSHLRSGFRAFACDGLCLAGEEDGCANVYDSVGAEAAYSVLRGQLAVAPDGGIYTPSIDRGHVQAKLGTRVRYKNGRFTALFQPSVFAALNER